MTTHPPIAGAQPGDRAGTKQLFEVEGDPRAARRHVVQAEPAHHVRHQADAAAQRGLSLCHRAVALRNAAEIAGAPAEYVHDLRTRPAGNVGPGS